LFFFISKDTRPTFRENRGQFHKQNNTNNMEYYNIRNRDMGRNDVWDMSRDDVWDMSRDDVWDLGSNDVCCEYCGERNHTHSECKHGTYIQCDSCYEYGHKAKVCKLYWIHGHGDSSIKYKIVDKGKGRKKGCRRHRRAGKGKKKNTI
jgi:hypothetical protein